MVVQKTQSVMAGQVALWAIAVTVILAGFGGIYSLAQSVGEVNHKLDRNCGYIRDISIGLQLHEAVTDGDTRRPVFPDVRC